MATKKKTTTKTAAPAATVERDPSAEATATHRAICVAVAPAQRAACEAIFTAFDAANGTQFSGPDGMLTELTPGWDGVSEPKPPTLCFFGKMQSSVAEMALFEQMCESAAGFGLKRYEAIVIPWERFNPANTVDSIYAANAYNPALPMKSEFSGVAAWALDVLEALPPRDNLP
jgi:hypothetical protein